MDGPDSGAFKEWQDLEGVGGGEAEKGQEAATGSVCGLGLVWR